MTPEPLHFFVLTFGEPQGPSLLGALLAQTDPKIDSVTCLFDRDGIRSAEPFFTSFAFVHPHFRFMNVQVRWDKRPRLDRVWNSCSAYAPADSWICINGADNFVHPEFVSTLRPVLADARHAGASWLEFRSISREDHDCSIEYLDISPQNPCDLRDNWTTWRIRRNLPGVQYSSSDGRGIHEWPDTVNGFIPFKVPEDYRLWIQHRHTCYRDGRVYREQ